MNGFNIKMLTKLGISFGIGFFGVYLGLPEEQYQTLLTQVVHPIRAFRQKMSYYDPKKMNQRNQDELLLQAKQIPGSRAIFKSDKSPAEERRRIRFNSDLHNQITMAEIASSQRGLTTDERKAIIIKTIRKHYPETFPDADQAVLQELEEKHLNKFS